MSELRALRDRTADRLVAAGIAPAVIRAAWLPTQTELLPALMVTAMRSRMQPEARSGNMSGPSFVESGTVVVVMRRTGDDGAVIENALLADQDAILHALLDDADWLAEIESVEAVEATLRHGSENEVTLSDLVMEITASWRVDYGASGVPFTKIRGRLPGDTDPTFGADLDQ